ncbi:MAG: hypothetical protein H0U53_03475, partial [Actinobacteria bacterium]|nr:hypothetical protein [Actinomycetota bacterium]
MRRSALGIFAASLSLLTYAGAAEPVSSVVAEVGGGEVLQEEGEIGELPNPLKVLKISTA